MLVLARKRNEEVVINGDIVIQIVEIRGDSVRLGIAAPKEVPVNRREVHERILREGSDREKPGREKPRGQQDVIATVLADAANHPSATTQSTKVA